MVQVNHIYGLIQLEHVTGKLRGDGCWVYIRGTGGIFLVSSQPSAFMHTQTGMQAQRGMF